jgi:hypothetical protein
MATECSLILAGNSPIDAFLSRLFPSGASQPDFHVSGRVWIADLHERMGFELRLLQGAQGYFGAEAGEEYWTWELNNYLNLGFRFDKFFPRDVSLRHMLQMVARILETGDEDAAMIQNGNELLLFRKAGKLTRFRAQGFWDSLAPEDIPNTLRVASLTKEE